MAGGIVAGSALCASLLLSGPSTPRSNLGPNEFVLTEMSTPISFDPLEADYTNNLHASQMLHQSLLEVGPDNSLKSSILKNFSYDPSKGEIALTVDPNAKFSDGSPITVEDIEITVKRMAAKRPSFPVIRHIVGVERWASQQNPLTTDLSGLKVEGQTLRIKLSANVREPLFRFALPLYGVVKKSCIDLKANKLSKDCPTSGLYGLEKTEGNVYRYKLHQQFQGAGPAENVNLRYISRPLTEADLKEFQNGSFSVFYEEHTTDPSTKLMQEALGFSRVEHPNARFSAFLLNPRAKGFEDAVCRLLFATTMRKHLSSTLSTGQLESSLLSRIMPGYLDSKEIERNPLSQAQVQNCKDKLKGVAIKWMPMSTHANSQPFEAALKMTAEELSLKIQTLPEVARNERFEAFVNNGLDILLASSGFWAFDPVGDVQMLFTRGLHKPIQFVSSDNRLQKMLNGLEFEENPAAKLQEINRYIYEQGLFNVYAHSKRVYLNKGPATDREIPIAITPPAPWQVFHAAKSQ